MTSPRDNGERRVGILLTLLWAFVLVVLTGCAGSGARDVNSSPTSSAPGHRDEVVDLLLGAYIPGEGFSELPITLSQPPDLRSTLLSATALEKLGSLTQATRVRTTAWARHYLDDDGRFRADGPVGPVDVAVLYFRVAQLLTAPEMMEEVDLDWLVP